MNQKIEAAKNGIAEVINYLILFAIGVIIQADFTEAGPDFAGLILAGFLPLLFWLVREWCGSFWLFLLLHLLPWGAYGLLYKGNIVQKLWLFFVLALLTVMSFRKKLCDRDMGTEAAHPVFTVCVLWGLYLIDGMMSGGKWGEFLLYTGTGFAAGYFLRYFLQHFLRYMDVNNRTTENIPAAHVFRCAVILAGGFTAAAGGMMILGSNRALMDRMGEALWQLITRILRFLFSLLFRESPEEEESFLGETEEAAEAGMGVLPEAGEPSLLARILEVALEIFVALALVLLAVWAVVALVRLIREVFARGKKKSAAETVFGEDLIEKLEKREKRQKGRPEGGFFDRVGKVLSPEERIRRIYRKTLEKELSGLKDEEREKLFPGATPRECCMELFPEQEMEAMAFASLYEKARYGRGLCGSEDVKRARKLAEEFHR